jgi:hypothetical protein
MDRSIAQGKRVADQPAGTSERKRRFLLAAKWLAGVVGTYLIIEGVLKPLGVLVIGPVGGLIDRFLDEPIRLAPLLSAGSSTTSVLYVGLFFGFMALGLMTLRDVAELPKSDTTRELLASIDQMRSLVGDDAIRHAELDERAEKVRRLSTSVVRWRRQAIGVSSAMFVVALLTFAVISLRISAERVAAEFHVNMESAAIVISGQEQRELTSAFAQAQTRADMQKIRSRLYATLSAAGLRYVWP